MPSNEDLPSLPNAFSLNQLGLSDRNLKRLLVALKKPHGLILFSGPTGSGKTVTLYSALSQIANPGVVETLAVEDPIEYLVPNTQQHQLGGAAGQTYAQAIKKFMRATPENIAIGEINDAETASAALDASLVGHLVLSTIHAKSASEVPARLADLGVPSHLACSALSALVAQRLVRTLCNKCKEAYCPEPEELYFAGFAINGKKWTEGDSIPELYKAHKGGCTECSGTGFRGRTAVYEILLVNDTIRHLIYTSAEAAAIEAKAIETGMTKMIDDGWAKVLSGTTTLQEVIKSVFLS